jgi:cell wall-associated NlpC family hydrolase
MDKFKTFMTGMLLVTLLTFCGSPQKSTSMKDDLPSAPKKDEAAKRIDAAPGQAKNVSLKDNETTQQQKQKFSGSDSNDETAQLQKKYSVYLGTQPGTITNIKLYRFIDEWLNTPYLWGGMDKRGIDCSAFVQKLLSDVYRINITIDRTAVDQFFAKWIDRFASTKSLAEGDLVFFKTIKGRPITHVGFYCGNGKFINSSSRLGVSFGNLEDPYWKSKFVAAGRIRQSAVTTARN